MELVEHREIIGCRVDGFCGECDEAIGNSTEGGNNDDGRRIKPVDNLLNLQHGFGRAHGGAAEFEDFHRGAVLNERSAKLSGCRQGSRLEFHFDLYGFGLVLQPI